MAATTAPGMEPVYASGYGEKQKFSRSMPKAAAYVKYFEERRDELGADRTEEQFEQLRRVHTVEERLALFRL